MKFKVGDRVKFKDHMKNNEYASLYPKIMIVQMYKHCRVPTVIRITDGATYHWGEVIDKFFELTDFFTREVVTARLP